MNPKSNIYVLLLYVSVPFLIRVLLMIRSPQNKFGMPVNGCYSNRGGTNWSGFSNDAVSSFRIQGNGRCRYVCSPHFLFQSSGMTRRPNNLWHVLQYHGTARYLLTLEKSADHALGSTRMPIVRVAQCLRRAREQ